MGERFCRPRPEDQAVLDSIQVRLLQPDELPRCNRLLDEHHYLGSPQPVGERLYYVVTNSQGEWLALLVLSPVFLAVGALFRAQTPRQRCRELSTTC